MDKRVMLLVILCISFVSVSADYFPKDYSVTYGGDITGQSVFNWVFTEGYMIDVGQDWGIYPNYSSPTSPSNAYINLESFVNVSHDASGSVIMFRPNPSSNWGNPSNANMYLEFIDSSGIPIFPTTSQITLIQPTNCIKNVVQPGNEVVYIYLDKSGFTGNCRFNLDPSFKSLVSKVRLTIFINYNDIDVSSFYFRPELYGPFVPPFSENCSEESDEDQDSFGGCADPDCNGFIPGGPITPSFCGTNGIYDFPWGVTWNETTLIWTNDEIQFNCNLGPTGQSEGYCCPVNTFWYGSSCSVAAPLPVCGDSEVNQASEQCDDGNTIDTDECSNTCQIQAASACNNNNLIDLPGEVCDGSDLNNMDCVGLGYDSGNLDCDSNCDFDTSDCENDPTGPGNTNNPPIVGPNQYILNSDCEEDSNPNDEFGELTWTIYNQYGVLNSTGTTTCVLEREKIPFIGVYSIFLFVLILVGFYVFRKKFK